MCCETPGACVFLKFSRVWFLRGNDSQKKLLACDCRKDYGRFAILKDINLFCLVGQSSAIFHIDLLGYIVCLSLAKCHQGGKQV